MLMAKHDLNGVIYFEEYHPKPFDMKRLQAGMFIDRPDLWKKKPRRPRRVSPDQIPMFTDPEDLHLDFTKPVACSLTNRGRG